MRFLFEILGVFFLGEVHFFPHESQVPCYLLPELGVGEPQPLAHGRRCSGSSRRHGEAAGWRSGRLVRPLRVGRCAAFWKPREKRSARHTVIYLCLLFVSFLFFFFLFLSVFFSRMKFSSSHRPSGPPEVRMTQNIQRGLWNDCGRHVGSFALHLGGSILTAGQSCESQHTVLQFLFWPKSQEVYLARKERTMQLLDWSLSQKAIQDISTIVLVRAEVVGMGPSHSPFRT